MLNAAIKDVFVTTFAKLDTDSNIQKLEDNSTVRWHHFYYELPRPLVYRGSDTVQNEYRTQQQVFNEITVSAIWSRFL